MIHFYFVLFHSLVPLVEEFIHPILAQLLVVGILADAADSRFVHIVNTLLGVPGERGLDTFMLERIRGCWLPFHHFVLVVQLAPLGSLEATACLEREVPASLRIDRNFGLGQNFLTPVVGHCIAHLLMIVVACRLLVLQDGEEASVLLRQQEEVVTFGLGDASGYPGPELEVHVLHHVRVLLVSLRLHNVGSLDWAAPHVQYKGASCVS